MGVTERVLAERPMMLVADDDHDVCELVARVIVRLGFVPLRARDGAAAVLAASTCQPRLVCAILDVQMPVLNGADAAHAIQQQAPNLAIVLMSGAIPASLHDRVKQLRTAAILAKPFQLTELREVLVRAAAGVQAR